MRSGRAAAPVAVSGPASAAPSAGQQPLVEPVAGAVRDVLATADAGSDPRASLEHALELAGAAAYL